MESNCIKLLLLHIIAGTRFTFVAQASLLKEQASICLCNTPILF